MLEGSKVLGGLVKAFDHNEQKAKATAPTMMRRRSALPVPKEENGAIA
jgi:hypothetical protein